jgi:hypothetical protein
MRRNNETKLFDHLVYLWTTQNEGAMMVVLKSEAETWNAQPRKKEIYTRNMQGLAD